MNENQFKKENEKINFDKEIINNEKSLLWREKNLLMNNSEFTNSRERNPVRASEQERVKLGLRGLRALLSRRLKGESKSERKGISREGKTLSPSPSPRRGWQGLVAFTLAETLIALTVLGVIAAITIPGIIRHYQEKATVMKVKKIYSILNDAVSQAEIMNGPVQTWDIGNKDDTVKAANYIIPFLKVQKDCGNADRSCFATNIKLLHGQSDNWSNQIGTLNIYRRIMLNDGTSMTFWSNGNTNCRAKDDAACINIKVDINGLKDPNRLGYDIFEFWIRSHKNITNGIAMISISDRCKYKGTSEQNGSACTFWILRKGNMHYIRRDITNEFNQLVP